MCYLRGRYDGWLITAMIVLGGSFYTAGGSDKNKEYLAPESWMVEWKHGEIDWSWVQNGINKESEFQESD